MIFLHSMTMGTITDIKKSGVEKSPEKPRFKSDYIALVSPRSCREHLKRRNNSISARRLLCPLRYLYDAIP